MSVALMKFVLATLAPAALLLSGAIFGGVFSLIAFGYVVAAVAIADEWVKPDLPARARFLSERVIAILPVALAFVHVVLMVAAIYSLAEGTAETAEKIALFLAFGLYFGQVSNSVAHELIHRPDRLGFWAGTLVFASHLFAHHASAHRLVHHVHVATPNDPNSARKGDSFYRFARRAWLGSFEKGLAAEMRMRRAKSGMQTPYPIYVSLAVAWIVLALAIGGPKGVLFFLALAGHATSQLLMSDYVQHYGLSRARLKSGKYEAVSPRHSWNSPHRLSNYMMVFAPRHSDHHLHPGRPFGDLSIEDDYPVLPHSLPLMGAVALFPRRWKKIMNPRLEALQG